MKKQFKLSGFDLGIVIAFVVVTLLGGGAWWYLSGELTDAQTDRRGQQRADFDKYSVEKPIPRCASALPNQKTLQSQYRTAQAPSSCR